MIDNKTTSRALFNKLLITLNKLEDANILIDRLNKAGSVSIVYDVHLSTMMKEIDIKVREMQKKMETMTSRTTI